MSNIPAWEHLSQDNISKFLKSRVEVESYSLHKWRSMNWNKKDIVVDYLENEGQYRFMEITTYPCLMPVTYMGDIVFNNGENVLYVSNGVAVVYNGRGQFGDARELFIWERISYSGLIPGDTAYRTNEMPLKLDDTQAICKIVADNQYRYINDNLVKAGNFSFKYWFKLVRKYV